MGLMRQQYQQTSRWLFRTLFVVWCWTAIGIPLWCIADCQPMAQPGTAHYVCTMLQNTPADGHTPRISHETLHALALLVLSTALSGWLGLQRGARVGLSNLPLQSAIAPPASPPPKTLPSFINMQTM